MKNISALAEVKPLFGRLSKFERSRRYPRAELNELKRWAASQVPRLFPYGVLSPRGGYWLLPALDLQINLGTGDFYPLRFDLLNPRPIDDILYLYGTIEGLTFAQTVAALKRMRAEPETPVFVPAIRHEREKRRLLAAALLANGDGERLLSALAIRRELEAYLASLTEEAFELRCKHPEFFSKRTFNPVLEELSARPEQTEFLRIEKKTDGKKYTRFRLTNLCPKIIPP